MSRVKSFGVKLFVSSLSGIIYALSQPKFELYFLAPFFYLPLHVYHRKTGNTKIYLWGGFVAYFITVHWITHAITYYGGFPYLFALVPLCLLSTLLGAFFLLFGYVREKISSRTNIPYSVLDPVIWVSTEYIKTFVFTGFPWALVGYSLWRNETLIQIADIGGVYMLSFLIMSWGGLMCDIYDEIRNRFYLQISRGNQRMMISVLFSFFFTSFSFLYGVWRKKQIDTICESKKEEIAAVVIQPSVPMDEKWTPDFKEKYFRLNLQLSIAPIDQRYDRVLVVWPETGLTFYLDREPKYKSELLRFARERFFIVAGGLGTSQKGNDIKLHNRAFLITPHQQVYTYDKTHLVMFGEYIPMRDVLEKIPFTRKLIEEVEKVAGDFTPGDRVHAIGDDEFKVGVPICFESIFPSIVREFVRDGAHIIAVITNDAWFGYSSGPFQHFSVSAIRAVETRRFVLRSANSGISGAFSPTGKLIAETRLLERTSFLVKVKKIDIETFYVRYGDVFSIVCVFLTFFLYIYLYGRGRNRNLMR